MIRIRPSRLRRAIAATVSVIAATVLAGCASPAPYAVANHDDKVGYHSGQVEGMLTEQAFVSLSNIENYSAVGYMHINVSSGETLHMQHETSKLGNLFWSQESTDRDGMTIDRVHMAGSDSTYYLFGDAYLSVSKTPWVSFPEPDIPAGDPERVCIYPAVGFMCAIADAWETTAETHSDSVPTLVEKNADGSMHLASAVTLQSVVDSGLLTIGEELRGRISEETIQTLVPLHVWFDANGTLTKAEINGQFGDDPSFELQFGFEIKGEPNQDEQPQDPATLDQQFVSSITDRGEIEAFWDEIARVRQGG
ncbi:MAG: hypothetical protein ACTH31_06575 [Pseudoclavibacter sp.]